MRRAGALLALLALSACLVRADLEMQILEEDNSTPGISSSTYAILQDGKVVGVVEHYRSEARVALGRKFGPTAVTAAGPHHTNAGGSMMQPGRRAAALAAAEARVAELLDVPIEAMKALAEQVLAGCPWARLQALARLQAAAALQATMDSSAVEDAWLEDEAVASDARMMPAEEVQAWMDEHQKGGHGMLMGAPHHRGPMFASQRPGATVHDPMMARPLGIAAGERFDKHLQYRPTMMHEPLDAGSRDDRPAFVPRPLFAADHRSDSQDLGMMMEQPVEEQPLAAHSGHLVPRQPRGSASRPNPMVGHHTTRSAARHPGDMLHTPLPAAQQFSSEDEMLDFQAVQKQMFGDAEVEDAVAAAMIHSLPAHRRPMRPHEWVALDAAAPGPRSTISWALYDDAGHLNVGLVTFVGLAVACVAVWTTMLVQFARLRSARINNNAAAYLIRAYHTYGSQPADLKPLLREDPVGASKDGVEVAAAHVPAQQRSVNVLHYEPLPSQADEQQQQ